MRDLNSRLAKAEAALSGRNRNFAAEEEAFGELGWVNGSSRSYTRYDGHDSYLSIVSGDGALTYQIVGLDLWGQQ